MPLPPDPPKNQSVSMKWTTEKPKTAGNYWVKAPNLTPRISLYHECHGQGWLVGVYDMNNYGSPAEYAGPIPLPNAQADS